MTRHLTAIALALAVSCAPSLAQEAKREPRVFFLLGDTEENFEKHIKPLTEAIAKAKKLVIYEGLPHQRWERDLLDRELKEKKSVKFHGYPFYEARTDPKVEDFKKLTTLCAKKASFGRYQGERLCGGYHPDWCVEWKDGDQPIRILICFGCGEARLYGPKSELWMDLTKDSAKSLHEILSPYQKNRPKRDDNP